MEFFLFPKVYWIEGLNVILQKRRYSAHFAKLMAITMGHPLKLLRSAADDEGAPSSGIHRASES
ncbi:Uncharacterised protein [uncultured archaeon]|nr:Uncharacterised protein [uncultured archaeon]